MPRLTADEDHSQDVERRLHTRGLKHLRARRYGAAVIVESGPKDDAVKHFRVRRDAVDLWCLDIANHRGAWESTPYRERLEKLVRRVLEEFPWTVENVFGSGEDDDHGGDADPEGTSGAEH